MDIPIFGINNMEHKLSECKIERGTRQDSSVDSYLYTCPACNEQRRYAFPEAGWGVFCDGLDWRTDELSDRNSETHNENVAIKFEAQKVDVDFLIYFVNKKNGQMVFEDDDRKDHKKLAMFERVKVLEKTGLIEKSKLEKQIIKKIDGDKRVGLFHFDYYKVTDLGLKLIKKYGDTIK